MTIIFPVFTLKNWLTDMLRTSLSLYSAELVFLESGRQEVDYFEKGRGIWSLFKRYLVPQSEHLWLKILIWVEIILFGALLIGFALSLASWLIMLVKFHLLINSCTWLRVLPFIGLFIIISLSGGYARMRLPIEPLIIILSLRYWITKRKIYE